MACRWQRPCLSWPPCSPCRCRPNMHPSRVVPEQQKQKTQQALVTILLAMQPNSRCFVMEDLHWADPSTLELLSLLVDQGPTARILVLCTFRPDFRPPVDGAVPSHPAHADRLPRRQAEEMMRQVAHGKALPAEVVEQIVAKTDGVPLFVEELTKMVLESGLLQEGEDHYVLTGPLPPLAIPATLQDSLMARLDRLATVKSLAQLGATLGREFSYALLQAVSPLDEATVQQGLHQLVEAEFLYQQGLPPHATYLFKHALIQDAAYQSLLQEHPAAVPPAHCPGLGGSSFLRPPQTQPELLAHHSTEAGLSAQAVAYWQRAGQRAIERSANLEAISHLTKGLEVLATLPRHRRAGPAGARPAHRLGSSPDRDQGLWRPRSGTHLRQGPRAVSAGGRPRELFPVLRGLWTVSYAMQSITRGWSWGSSSSAWPTSPRSRASSMPTVSWGCVVVPRGVAGCPSASGAGHRPLRAAPAP